MSDSGSINQRWALDGSDEFVAQLRKIADEAQRTQATLSGATEKASGSVAGLEQATISLQAAFRELSGIAGSAAGPITRILSSLSGLTSGFGAIGTAIVGVTAGLGALARQGATAAEEIRDGALRVGTSAENYSALRFVLEQSGAGAEGFERAMGKVFEASNTADKAGDQTAEGAAKIDDATTKMAASQEKIADLFRKKNQDLADEQRKSLEQISDLTRRKGTAEEEITFQSARRVEEINRQSSRQLNEIIRQRNKDAQDSLAAFNKQLAETNQKWAEGGDAFSKLGVKLKGSNGEIRDTAEIFKDVAEQVSKIENPTARSAKAMELFSRRAGPKLVEALSLGRKGIEELAAEGEHLGLVFSKAQTEVGDKFNDAMRKLSGTIAATSEKIGLLFAPAFTAIADAMAGAFGGMQKPILDALAPIAKDFENLFTGNLTAVQSQFLLGMRDVMVNVVVPAFQAAGLVIGSVIQTMGTAFQGLADVINAVFGTKFTAVDIPAFIVAIKLGAAAVSLLATAFGFLTAAAMANPLVAIATIAAVAAALIITNWEPIKKLFEEFAVAIGPSLNAAGESVSAFATGVVQFLTDLDASTRKIFADLGTSISDIFWAGMKLIGDAVTWVSDWIKTKLIDPVLNWFQWIIDKATEVGAAITSALSGLSGLLGGAGAAGSAQAISNNARGGFVRGPGTATSDSMLSWISNGEFIVNAAATRIFRPLLEAINRGVSPFGGRGAPGFALGGVADFLSARRSLMPTSAPFFTGRGLNAAGAGAAGRPFTLVIDSKTFGGMTASDDTINDFIQFARGARMRSLGRKPSYYGNG